MTEPAPSDDLREKLEPMVKRLARKAEIMLGDTPPGAPIRHDLMELRALARMIERTVTGQNVERV